MVAHAQNGGAALALALLAGCAANAEPKNNDLACKFRHDVREVDSFGAMPSAIQDYLKPKFDFDDPHTGGIAPRDGKWNATDVVMTDAPFRRFIRAGHAGDKWFLWYERGGIAYFKVLAVFGPGSPSPVLAHMTSPTPDLCAATDKALDGKGPPVTETIW